jgi:hypothetical protein
MTCPNLHCKNGYVGNVGCAICKGAAPSPESGALLLDALETAVRTYCEGNLSRDSFDDVREVVRRRLSTLERDAARMREAAQAVVDSAFSGGHYLGVSSGAMATLRAALSPSGEPTTETTNG